MTGVHYLLWDGDCGFCSRTVAWFSGFLDARVVVPIPFQSAEEEICPPALRAACEHRIYLRHPDGSATPSIRAIAGALRLSGRPRVAAALLLPGARHVLELGYRLVARNRTLISRLFRRQSCSVPPAGGWAS